MSVDSVKGLVDMASAITGLSVDKARDVTRSFLTAALNALDDPAQAASHVADALRTGGAHASSSMAEGAEDIADKVREEVDRMAARFGFVREEELAALRARVQKLEAALKASASATPTPGSASKAGSANRSSKPAKTTSARTASLRPTAKTTPGKKKSA